MRQSRGHTTEDASAAELWHNSWVLIAMLVILALLVVPIIRELPLGHSTRTAILAWLLVVAALYWLYAGMGYRALLLVQLFLFSSAAALLSAKLLLVAIDVHRLTLLRSAARALILLGAACTVVNAVGMVLALVRRRASRHVT